MVDHLVIKTRLFDHEPWDGRQNFRGIRPTSTPKILEKIQKLTANAPENRPGPKRKLVFQSSIFRVYVSFREGKIEKPNDVSFHLGICQQQHIFERPSKRICKPLKMLLFGPIGILAMYIFQPQFIFELRYPIKHPSLFNVTSCQNLKPPSTTAFFIGLPGPASSRYGDACQPPCSSSLR